VFFGRIGCAQGEYSEFDKTYLCNRRGRQLVGKGLTSASVGLLLERRGLTLQMQKFDPYINVDPGTMSPYQHGEVYVLDDGAEPIWTSATTSVSPTPNSTASATSPPVASTRA